MALTYDVRITPECEYKIAICDRWKLMSALVRKSPLLPQKRTFIFID